VKKVLYLSLSLLLITLLIECKEANDFSPGASDSRITGTWRLAERRFPINKDSLLIDSTLVQGQYVIDSTFVNGQYVKDSVFVKEHYRKDSLSITKSIDTTLYYSTSSSQTLTFDANGKLSANGNEMSYYFPIKYFRVDTTYPDSLFLSLYVTTNRANVFFQQGLKFKADTLLLLPRCERLCYSKFVRLK
jgi:hypothetical protein